LLNGKGKYYKVSDMKKNIVYSIILLLGLVSSETYGQKAEYNAGNNWLYPGGQKFIGMNFINSDKGVLMNNGMVWFNGNLTNDGVVGFDNSLLLNPAQSMFASDALQHISGTGTTRFYSVMFGSQLAPVAYSLEQPITVAQQVNFSKGILAAQQTTPETMMNMLQVENGAICINASDASYVDGFVSKTGNSAFTFPVGNGGFYRPISIGTTATATDCFAARYLYVNPDLAGYARTNKVGTLSRISDKEYWVLNRTNGTTNGKVMLSWDVNKTSAAIPTDLLTLVVARWDGTQWINEGNTSTTGNSNAGTITANVTGYGVFTLANAAIIPPVVLNDSITTYENVAASATVFPASDKPVLTLTAFSVNGVSYQPGTTATILNVGTVTAGTDGMFTYSPALNYNGVLPTITYTISNSNNNTNDNKGVLTIRVLPLPQFIKTSNKPFMNNDGSFSWFYTLSILNDTPINLKNVQVEDNLDDVFGSKGYTYKVNQIVATGQLIGNGLYNGSNIVKLLVDGSMLAPGKQDSIRFEVNVTTHSQSDTLSVFNQAILKMGTTYGDISMKSHADSATILPLPTQTDIPIEKILIPDGFSPNGDGVNDQLVIVHEPSTRLDIEVFNRNGNIVYKSSDYQNNWDGKGTGSIFGNDLPDGTYYLSYKLTKISTGAIVNKGVKFIALRH
jgi:gliding motility-associated-like protein